MKNKTSVKGEDGIRGIFHARRLKCTPQRLSVFKVLEESETYLSINSIHAKVKALLPGTGLATVYRSLETLIDLGLVVKVHLEDGCHSYAVAPEGHRHPIVCTECSKVIDFAECPLDKISEKLSRDTGIQIQNHFLQLFGTCRECGA